MPRHRFGVRLGGVGPGGLVRLHYPDLLLIGRRDERVAFELELSGKGRRRLETILAGYGAEPNIRAVVYLADKAAIRREVSSTAARLGISELVCVQRFMWPAAGTAARATATDRVPATLALARAGGPARTVSRSPGTCAVSER